MSLKFCIIIELNSQKTFFTIVLYTNMATMTSHENRDYYCFFRTPVGLFGLKSSVWCHLNLHKISVTAVALFFSGMAQNSFNQTLHFGGSILLLSTAT